MHALILWDFFFGFNWLIELWRFYSRRIGRFCDLHLMPLQKEILQEVWTENRWAVLYCKYCHKCSCFANNADLYLSLPNNDSKRSVQVSYTSSVQCVCVSLCMSQSVSIQVQVCFNVGRKVWEHTFFPHLNSQ